MMLTAEGREVEIERGLALGADAYITKPFSTRNCWRRSASWYLDSMRILIAEDDAGIAAGLTHALRRSGYAVDCVTNGAQADAALAANRFDLLILDLGLPKLDGLEVLRRARASGRRLPILILTARDSVDDRVRGLDLGADDYMPKPFSISELEARVRALIRRGEEAGGPMVECGKLRYDKVHRRATIGERRGTRLYKILWPGRRLELECVVRNGSIASV